LEDNKPGAYKAGVGDDKEEAQRKNTRGTPERQGKPKEDRIATAKRLAKTQQDLRSKMLPLSKVPCKLKALTGKDAHPRKHPVWEELGVPRHIVEIGAWHRGRLLDFDMEPLVSAFNRPLSYS
jgi:hypothetical protein